MTNFPCGVTAKLLVLRLHRSKKSLISLKYYRDLAATPPKKAKAEIAVDVQCTYRNNLIINKLQNIVAAFF
jgi:hypothetical protein